MEIRFNKYLVNSKEYSLEINSKDITGIYTNDEYLVQKILSFKYPLKGEIFINEKKITEENINSYQRLVSIVYEYKPIAYIKTVLDYMNIIITNKNIFTLFFNYLLFAKLRIIIQTI